MFLHPLNFQVDMWLEKCEQNISKMEREGIDPVFLRQQYPVLNNLNKVINGRSFFTGIKQGMSKEE